MSSPSPQSDVSGVLCLVRKHVVVEVSIRRYSFAFNLRGPAIISNELASRTQVSNIKIKDTEYMRLVSARPRLFEGLNFILIGKDVWDWG